MRPGDRVIVHVHWSSFHGQRGVVVSTAPLMVKLDGDLVAMRFGDREVQLEEPSTVNLSGAE